jgi:hypothetical protein
MNWGMRGADCGFAGPAVAVAVAVAVSLVGILKGTACTLLVLRAELALLTDEEGFE